MFSMKASDLLTAPPPPPHTQIRLFKLEVKGKKLHYCVFNNFLAAACWKVCGSYIRRITSSLYSITSSVFSHWKMHGRSPLSVLPLSVLAVEILFRGTLKKKYSQVSESCWVTKSHPRKSCRDPGLKNILVIHIQCTAEWAIMGRIH